MSPEERVEVRHDPQRTRYEILVDGQVAGAAHYTPVEGRLVFDHTVIDDAYAGRGLAKALARGALDDVRADDRRIVPICEFIAGFLAKNAEYDDLVDRELLERIRSSA
jgi:predicted GNAT family acetyltransferase